MEIWALLGLRLRSSFQLQLGKQNSNYKHTEFDTDKHKFEKNSSFKIYVFTTFFSDYYMIIYRSKPFGFVFFSSVCFSGSKNEMKIWLIWRKHNTRCLDRREMLRRWEFVECGVGGTVRPSPSRSRRAAQVSDKSLMSTKPQTLLRTLYPLDPAPERERGMAGFREDISLFSKEEEKK